MAFPRVFANQSSPVPLSYLDDDFNSLLAGDSGAGLVGFDATQAYPNGSIGIALQGSISVRSAPYNCDNTGVDCTAGLASAIAYAKLNKVRLVFPSGTYSFGIGGQFSGVKDLGGATQNYGILIDWPGADIEFQGEVRLMYTGASGYAVVLRAPGINYMNRVAFGVGNAPIINAHGARGCMLTHRVCRSDVGMWGEAAVTYALRSEFSVCTDFFMGSAANGINGWFQAPAYGLYMDTDLAGSVPSDNTLRIFAEGIAGDAIYINSGTHNTFIGGTAEANTGSGVVDYGSHNFFINMDAEVNGVADLKLFGVGATFMSPAAGSSSIVVSGPSSKIIGGSCATLTINSSAKNTMLLGVALPSGNGLVDNGAGTQYIGCFRATYTDTPLEPDAARPSTIKPIGAITVVSTTNQTNGKVIAPTLLLDYNDSITLAGMAGGTWASLNGTTFQIEQSSYATGANILMTGGALVDTTGFGTYTASSGTATHVGFNDANWGAAGGANHYPAYYVSADGTVGLVGNVKYSGGGSGTTKSIFTLPAGRRPGATLTFTCWDTVNAVAVPVTITTAGVVTPTYASGASANIALDAIRFKAEV